MNKARRCKQPQFSTGISRA